MRSENVSTWPARAQPWPAQPRTPGAPAGPLHQLARALDGEPPPCAEDAARWFSSEPDEIEAAEATCRTCPGATACDALAVANGEAWGVWGALDRSPTATRRRAARQRAAQNPTPSTDSTAQEAS